MDDRQKIAYNTLSDAGSSLRRLLVRAKAELQPLPLPDDVIKKIIKAQQAILAAQRLMEKTKASEAP